MKNTRKCNEKNGNPILVVVIAIIIIGFIVVATKSGKGSPPVSAAGASNYRLQLSKICKDYMAAATHQDVWWLKETVQPSVELSLELDNALTNIQNAVSSSAGASPLAKEISSTFKSFLVTEFMNGGAVAVTRGGQPVTIAGSMEICFVPESEFRKGRLPTTLFYRKDWNAVMMGAIAWPRIFFKGVLMHELGHAYQNKQKNHPSNFSREWFEDEVMMHTLETAVLDYHTSNRYSQKLLEVFKKHQSAKSVEQFTTSVTVDELLELDEAIGTRDCGNDVRGAACTQHIVMLGFTYIDQKKGSMDEKVAHYRWIIGK